MKTFFVIYAFVMGICVGSFLNVLVYRIPLKINVARGRSFCPNCKHTLAPKDLVPLFSFLFLGAKCRYCRVKISWQYFIVELICGILYALMVYLFYPSPSTFLYLLIVSVMLVIVLIDYQAMYIPPVLLIVIVISTVLYFDIFSRNKMIYSIVSSIIFAMPIIVASLIAKLMGKKSFGTGDVKLALALGLSIPFESVYNSLLFLLVVMVFKLIVLTLWKMFFYKKDEPKKIFPFADVICMAYFMCLLMK